MLLSRIVCAILLVASLPAQQSQPPASNSVAAPQPPAPAQHGFLISGLAVNSLTGQPIAGASVAIARLAQGTERDVSNSVITAADGRFSFSSLSQGKYSGLATARVYSLQYLDRHDI